MKLRVCAVLATLLSASSALAGSSCDGINMPPLSAQKPVTEPFQVFFVPDDQMDAKCKKMPNTPIGGCTLLADSGRSAVIYLNSSMDPAGIGCLFIYEKAHLKPNNWLDQAFEATAKNLPNVTDAVATFNAANNSPMDLGIPPMSGN